MYAICFILCVTIFMPHVIFTVYALFILIIFQYLILLVSVIIIVDGDAEKFFLKSDQMSEIWRRASCLSLALFSTPCLFYCLFFFFFFILMACLQSSSGHMISIVVSWYILSIISTVRYLHYVA